MFLGHATSPDGLRWTRDPANPIFTEVVGRGRLRRPSATAAYLMFAEGKDDIAHLLTSPDGRALDRPGTARHPQGRRRRRSAPGPTARRRPGSRTGPGTSSTSAATRASGSRPRRTARSGPTSRTTPSWRWAPSPTTARRRHQPDHQARRRLLRLLPRQRAQALEGLDDLRRPVARPGPLGEIPGQPDRRRTTARAAILVEHARGRPALHDAPRRQGLRPAGDRPR